MLEKTLFFRHVTLSFNKIDFRNTYNRFYIAKHIKYIYSKKLPDLWIYFLWFFFNERIYSCIIPLLVTTNFLYFFICLVNILDIFSFDNVFVFLKIENSFIICKSNFIMKKIFCLQNYVWMTVNKSLRYPPLQ